MDNYEFCAQWTALRVGQLGKALDYGCGAGRTVRILRTRSIDAYGCDIFYGESSPESLKEDVAPYVCKMTGDRIPFGDSTFDVVTSNMVLEHVPNLDVVVSETARVLKPGGYALHLFPDLGTWREGHCGLPFVHWLPKGRLRSYYATIARSMGLGSHRDSRSSVQWGRDVSAWLDQWTHYRSLADIHASFQRHFSIRHIEDEWFDARFGRSPLPRFARRFIVRKAAGIAVVLQRNQIGSKTALTPHTDSNAPATVCGASL
jgi:SAM-dependent methyltransferase